MRLFLVRNAETLWNREGRLQGHQDSPLTEDGKKQALLLADLLKSERFDAAYSSDLGRAIDTAKKIVSMHSGLDFQRKSELRERSHGIVQGMTQSDAYKKYPDLQKQRLKNKFLFKNPKGESYSDAIERLKPFWEELKKKHSNQSVLVVAHGGTTRLLLGLATEVKPEEILSIDQPHECIYIIENAENNAMVKYWTPSGIFNGALKRVQLKKMPKMEEESEEVGLEDDF